MRAAQSIEVMGVILGLFQPKNHDNYARYDAVVAPHLGAAYNLACWLTRSDQDAEDVVQEACVRASRFCDDFQGDDGRAWLLTIVRNTCYTWLRKNRQHELGTSFDVELHDIADEGCNPEVLLLQGIDAGIVRQAIRELPLELREILVLRELHGLSYKEIGRIAELPIGTVMSRLARARQKLQTTLATQLGEDERGGKQ